MRRREVTRRKKAVAEVRASSQAHRGRIGRKLDERSASPAEAAYAQAYFDHMDSVLAEIEGNLTAAEDEHVRKQIQISQAQKHSDDLAKSVYDKQTSTRQILVGLFGPEHQFELAAVSGKTPQGPQTLPEQVDQTVKLLRNPEGNTPAVRVTGVDINFGTLADELKGGLEGYRTSRVDLERLRKEGDATRLATNQAIDAFDQVFPWVAASLEGTFRLVGERDLANRIRTSVRRVNRRRNEDQEEESADSSSDQPTSASSSSEEPDAKASESSAEASSSTEASSAAGSEA